jgi:hypothetical protein
MAVPEAAEEGPIRSSEIAAEPRQDAVADGLEARTPQRQPPIGVAEYQLQRKLKSQATYRQNNLPTP